MEPIVLDDRIAAVTLTGSEGAGSSVGAAAGKAIKKTVLELGGSDYFIVLADADLEQAAEIGVKARFQNTGQSCIAAKRFIVEDAVYDRYVERSSQDAGARRSATRWSATRRSARWRAPTCATSSSRKCATPSPRARSCCAAASRCRARARTSRRRSSATSRPGMRMAVEETFGPAAAIMRARDAEHAVELANDSRFGLGGNLWTRDIAQAEELAARLESGNCFINGMTASDPRLPFGGVKKSGIGRELSEFGIREFVNVQTVWIGPDTGASAARRPAE